LKVSFNLLLNLFQIISSYPEVQKSHSIEYKTLDQSEIVLKSYSAEEIRLHNYLELDSGVNYVLMILDLKFFCIINFGAIFKKLIKFIINFNRENFLLNLTTLTKSY
jgi:hypothetical protein